MITVEFQYLGAPPGSRILDIGCGSGRHVAAAYGLKQVTVIGADRMIADLHQARQRLEFHDRVGAHGNGQWYLAGADISTLPFPDECFDVVICSEVLEHIAEHEQAIAELARVLKPGGHLVVSVPRRWPETICWALSRQYRQTKGGHVRIYLAADLVARIQKKGLGHCRTCFAHSLHTPYWWLKCLLGPEREDLTPVSLYHRFLTWDIMTKPRLTALLDRALNPFLGKSVVLYFRKFD
jgi:SAM-dependent methyltransferase